MKPGHSVAHVNNIIQTHEGGTGGNSRVRQEGDPGMRGRRNTSVGQGGNTGGERGRNTRVGRTGGNKQRGRGGENWSEVDSTVV